MAISDGTHQLTGPRVVVLVYDRLCLFEFGIAVEVFGLPRPEFGSDWYRFQVCAAEGDEVRATGGVRVRAEAGLESLEHADIVIVPGWRGPRQRPPNQLVTAIADAHARGARIVGLCGGVFVLAATGLLSSKCATTHWQFLDEFVMHNPDICVNRETLYCDDGRILTSAGSAAAIDLCLHIVRCDYGAEKADVVARRLVVAPLRGGDQPQRDAESLVPACKDQRLSDFLRHMKENLATQYTSQEAAQELSMSLRSFHRKFQLHTGVSYGKWISEQRLERAMHLLRETDLAVEQIADACGFASSGSLRRLFREHSKGSPKAYRTMHSRE
ncbi:MAG: helix-turn-helix domain-containing protein [Phycisphaera sp.]|nr:MAG: helix-turn-helix domain-containing protein [Phycisphaera sp.]